MYQQAQTLQKYPEQWKKYLKLTTTSPATNGSTESIADTIVSSRTVQ